MGAMAPALGLPVLYLIILLPLLLHFSKQWLTCTLTLLSLLSLFYIMNETPVTIIYSVLFCSYSLSVISTVTLSLCEAKFLPIQIRIHISISINKIIRFRRQKIYSYIYDVNWALTKTVSPLLTLKLLVLGLTDDLNKTFHVRKVMLYSDSDFQYFETIHIVVSNVKHWIPVIYFPSSLVTSSGEDMYYTLDGGGLTEGLLLKDLESI